MANDGKEAVEMARETAYDFILMDIEMPVMGGLDATRAIRQHEAATGRAPTAIVGLSANAREEHIREGLDAGMDEYLTKPCRQKAIIACLKRHLVGQPRTDPV